MKTKLYLKLTVDVIQGDADPFAIAGLALLGHAFPAGSGSPWRNGLPNHLGRLHLFPGRTMMCLRSSCVLRALLP